jgi:hypothetical protein
MLKGVRLFAKVLIRVFGAGYLRAPNEEYRKRLMLMNEARGWPGMLGSVDCMHQRWKNCPAAWHKQYTDHHRDPTIVLEAVASVDLRIWVASLVIFLLGMLVEMLWLATTPSMGMIIPWGTIEPGDIDRASGVYRLGLLLFEVMLVSRKRNPLTNHDGMG